MSKIKCSWIGCKFNTGEVSFNADANCDVQGYCECKDDITLMKADNCIECGAHISALVCNNFEIK